MRLFLRVYPFILLFLSAFVRQLHKLLDKSMCFLSLNDLFDKTFCDRYVGILDMLSDDLRTPNNSYHYPKKDKATAVKRSRYLHQFVNIYQ